MGRGHLIPIVASPLPLLLSLPPSLSAPHCPFSHSQPFSSSIPRPFFHSQIGYLRELCARESLLSLLHSFSGQVESRSSCDIGHIPFPHLAQVEGGGSSWPPSYSTCSAAAPAMEGGGSSGSSSPTCPFQDGGAAAPAPPQLPPL